MIKIKIIDQLTHRLKEDIQNLKNARDNAKTIATDNESKAESKWDTRAIEAGYLAGAQSARIEELQQELELLENLSIKNLTNNDEIIIGALVKLECNNQQKHYFISPITGGVLLNIDNRPIMVVSVFSPIGKEVLGLSVDDIFELTTPSGKREYSVLEVQ